jgi:hypothetical protein
MTGRFYSALENLHHGKFEPRRDLTFSLSWTGSLGLLWNEIESGLIQSHDLMITIMWDPSRFHLAKFLGSRWKFNRQLQCELGIPAVLIMAT